MLQGLRPQRLGGREPEAMAALISYSASGLHGLLTQEMHKDLVMQHPARLYGVLTFTYWAP